MTVIIGPTLPEPQYSTVESIWDDLHETFAIDRYANPYPHFTLYGLDDADLDSVEDAVREVAADHDPFAVHTDGIGVFPGNHVWIPVARSEPLAALHRDVVDAVADLGSAPVPFYDPHRWFPHVGLALALGDERAGEVVSYLLERDFEWDFTVDSIAITCPPPDGERHELVASVEL